MQKNLQLSQNAITAAQTIGHLTFSPRARGRMVCNQAPELGVMSAHQADNLRGQLWSKKDGGEKKQKKPLKVRLRFVFPCWQNGNKSRKYTSCPACHRSHEDPLVGGKINCVCGRKLIVV